MSADPYENSTVQISVNRGVYDALAEIAAERNKSIERVISDLAWIYRSEKLAREGVFERMGKAIEALQQESLRNGNAEMTLDEINEEIEAARREAALAKIA